MAYPGDSRPIPQISSAATATLTAPSEVATFSSATLRSGLDPPFPVTAAFPKRKHAVPCSARSWSRRTLSSASLERRSGNRASRVGARLRAQACASPRPPRPSRPRPSSATARVLHASGVVDHSERDGIDQVRVDFGYQAETATAGPLNPVAFQSESASSRAPRQIACTWSVGSLSGDLRAQAKMTSAYSP